MEKYEKASSIAKREKKRARREAKAARKAANQIEEKKSRPNNVLLAILIFGVLIGMFAFVKGYNYFSKPASIEKYIADNGGEEQFGSMMIDMNTTASITAEKNSMKLVLDCTVEDDQVKEMKEYYTGKDGSKQIEYLGAYFLGNIKPLVRGFSGDIKVIVNVNGEEVASTDLTYKQAKKVLEGGDEEEDADADAEEAEGEGSDEADSGEGDAGADGADNADKTDDAGDAEEAESEGSGD